jgi:hypothetical protein
MKQIFTLICFFTLFSYAKSQTTDVFNISSYTALPSGWIGTNNVTTNDIVRSTYFLVDAGNPGDNITTITYDLSTFSTARFFINVATFGTGTNNPALIEISYNGGTSYTQSAVSATPSSSSYIAGFTGGLLLTGSLTNNVQIRIANNGTSGRGVRLQNIVLQGTIASGNSNASNIIATPTFTPTANVDYKNFVASDVLATNSIELGQFTIQDGGGATDADAVGTSLSAISFSLTGITNLDKVALYDGSTEIAELPATATLNFTGITALIAADDASKVFSLRATYKPTVTDNIQTVATITAANAAATGSGFAATNAGGAATSAAADDNRIEVIATQLAFVQNAINPTAPNVAMNPSPTVSANDINNNRDLDYVGNIDITSTGSLNGTTQSATAIAGLATFANITHSAAGINFVLTAAATGLTNVNSNQFNIATVYNGVPLSTSDVTTTIDFDNTLSFSNNGQFSSSTGITNSGAAGTLNSVSWAVASSGTETSAANFGTNVAAIAGTSLPGTVTGGGFFPMNLGSSNYGLGVQPTSSAFTPGFVALKLQNDLGVDLNTLDLSYTLYGVNDGGQSNFVKLLYSTDNITYTEATGLTYTTVQASVNTNLLKQYRAVRFNTLAIPNGGNLYIKWFFDELGGGSGNRDELVIDDIKLIPNPNNTKLLISGTYQTAVTNALVSLDAATTITDSIGVIGQLVELNSFNLTTPYVYNQNNAFIVMKSTGSLVLQNVGTVSKFAPVGPSGSDYTPVRISNTGVIDDFTIHPYQAHSACVSTTMQDSVVLLTMDISEATSGGSIVTLSINYNTTTTGVHFNPATAVIAHCDATNKVDYSGGVVNGTEVTITNVTSFSPFFITSDATVLPINVVSFKGHQQLGAIVLKATLGSTPTEVILERSSNGINFGAIGNMQLVAGNNYQFTDVQPNLINYYRLKLKDQNGAINYSNTLKMNTGKNASLSIQAFPVPSNNFVTLQLQSNKATNVTMQIFNANGNLLKSSNEYLQAGTNIKNIDIRSYNVGTYFVKVINEHENVIMKIVKQ